MAFNVVRRRLIERLDIEGPIRQLSAWTRLETDLEAALRQLA